MQGADRVGKGSAARAWGLDGVRFGRRHRGHVEGALWGAIRAPWALGSAMEFDRATEGSSRFSLENFVRPILPHVLQCDPIRF